MEPADWVAHTKTSRKATLQPAHTSAHLSLLFAEIGYAMSSKYAVAVYEMVCLRANLDRCVETIDLMRFRKLVGVPPGAYERGDNFMRFVIRPALLEVNGLSDLGVDIQMVRMHSRAPITAV